MNVQAAKGKSTKPGKTENLPAGPSVNTYVISAAELPKDISFEFNARSPSRASRAYKSMRETLASQPERFIELNGGISLASGRYVLDGGHTVTAILDAIREDSVDAKRVHVAVRDYGELSPAEMGARSAALNRRVTPPLMGEKDLEGVWDPIKNALEERYLPLFEFRPNTRPESKYSVSFLVALLHGWSETQAERCYSGKGQLVRLFSATKYARVLPHLNLAIEFYSAVYKMLLEDKRFMKLESVKPDTETTLPNGEVVKGAIPESLVWPTYAAFSYHINKNTGEWLTDPLAELKRVKGAMVKQLLGDLKGHAGVPGQYGKDPKAYLDAVIALRSA